MFGSDMLEVGIGLGLLFLLMSLICTAVREAIEGILKSRAKDLEQGIRGLLKDEEGAGLTKDLFDHPLLHGLFNGSYNPKDLSRNPIRSKRMGLIAGRKLPSLYGAFDVKLYFQALHLCRAHFSRVVVRSCPEAGSDHAHPSGGIGSGLASARLAIGGNLA